MNRAEGGQMPASFVFCLCTRTGKGVYNGRKKQGA